MSETNDQLNIEQIDAAKKNAEIKAAEKNNKIKERLLGYSMRELQANDYLK